VKDPDRAIVAPAQSLGVLGHDSSAIYQGALTRITARGTTRRVAGLRSASFVAPYPVVALAYGDFVSMESFVELIRLSKSVTGNIASAVEQPALTQ
jgi:hypothetical protein